MPSFGLAKAQLESELLAGAALTSDQIGAAILQAIEEHELERFWFTEGNVSFELNQGIASYGGAGHPLGYAIGIDTMTVRKRSPYPVIDPTLERQTTFTYDTGPQSWMIGETATATLHANGGGVAWDAYAAVSTMVFGLDDILVYSLRTGPSGVWCRFRAELHGGDTGSSIWHGGPVVSASQVLWDGTEDLGFIVLPNRSPDPFIEFTDRERDILRASNEDVRSLLRESQNNDSTYTVGAPEYWARFGGRTWFFPAPDSEYQGRAIGHMRFDLPEEDTEHSPWLDEGWYLIKARAKYNLCRSVTLDDQMATRAFEEEQRAMEALRRRSARRDATNFLQPFTV